MADETTAEETTEVGPIIQQKVLLGTVVAPAVVAFVAIILRLTGIVEWPWGATLIPAAAIVGFLLNVLVKQWLVAVIGIAPSVVLFAMKLSGQLDVSIDTAIMPFAGMILGSIMFTVLMRSMNKDAASLRAAELKAADTAKKLPEKSIAEGHNEDMSHLYEGDGKKAEDREIVQAKQTDYVVDEIDPEPLIEQPKPKNTLQLQAVEIEDAAPAQSFSLTDPYSASSIPTAFLNAGSKQKTEEN